MVGYYMDAPSDRIAWDRDGSLATLFASNGNAIEVLSVDQLRDVNSEAPGTYGFHNNKNHFAVVFSAPHDCASIFVSFYSINGSYKVPITVQTSKDTTNGFDGIWTTHTTTLDPYQEIKPNYRLTSKLFPLIPGTASSGIRGVRLITASVYSSADIGNWNPRIHALHVYGTPSASGGSDRVGFWHPTLDVPAPPTLFDWGDVPRSSSADKRFRIKNLSSSVSAKGVELYVEALTPGIPSAAGMHTISIDGGSTFWSLQTLPDLSPGEVSSEIVVRRTVPDNAQLSVWSARIAADVGEWE